MSSPQKSSFASRRSSVNAASSPSRAQISSSLQNCGSLSQRIRKYLEPFDGDCPNLLHRQCRNAVRHEGRHREHHLCDVPIFACNLPSEHQRFQNQVVVARRRHGGGRIDSELTEHQCTARSVCEPGGLTERPSSLAAMAAWAPAPTRPCVSLPEP